MNGFTRGFVATLALGLILAHGTQAETTTLLSLTNNAGGDRQIRLNWNSAPGARHRVAQSTNLTGGIWREVDLYESESDQGAWLDPQPVNPVQFYSVTDPKPEVFDLDPPFINFTNGSSSYIYGQFMPSNAALQVFTGTGGNGGPGALNGGSVYTYNLVLETNGVWRVDFPPGQLNGDTRILSAAIVDGSGNVLAPVDIDIKITERSQASDAPAG